MTTQVIVAKKKNPGLLDVSNIANNMVIKKMIANAVMLYTIRFVRFPLKISITI